MKRHSALRLVPAAAIAGALVAGCAPEGSVDATDAQVSVSGSTITVAGWAWDRDAPATPIDVHVYIDGSGMATRADQFRPDVGAAQPGAGPNHGFSLSINVGAGNHTVCTYGINAPGTPGGNAQIGRCRTVTVAPRPAPPVPAPTTTVTTRPAPVPTTPRPVPTTPPPVPTTPRTVPTTRPGPSVPTDPDAALSWQADLVKRINTSRAAAGAAPVAQCGRLETAAKSYAQTMASNQWFDTVGPDGSDAWTRVTDYGGSSSGENLSFGFASPEAVHTSQMASAAQADIVVSPELTDVGVGRALGDPDGDGPAAPAYYWVVELGAGGAC